MGRLERKATESKETHQRERTQFTGLASHGRRKEGRTIPSTVGRVLLHRVADRNDLRSMCACVVWCGVPNCVGIDKPAGYSLSLGMSSDLDTLGAIKHSLYYCPTYYYYYCYVINLQSS